MDNELYELKDQLKNAKTGHDFLSILLDWRQSDLKLMSPAMNQNNLMYIMGCIDALYYAGKIDQIEYTNSIKFFGL